MSSIEAVYQSGVFKPLGQVLLRDNQRVRLNIQPLEGDTASGWLAEVQQLQQKIVAERGYFPDSTADIAADRGRDE